MSNYTQVPLPEGAPEYVSESFTATNQLRFVRREVPSERNAGCMTHISILQQMWQGSNGTQKWQDVPMVME